MKDKSSLKKNSYSHNSTFYGEKEFLVYKKRLGHIRLTWCKQILGIINSIKLNINSINDLGCNYFQLYKEIKLQKLKYKYYGYDADEQFLKLGLKKFPELKKKSWNVNVENFKLKKTDCTVASAILEHCDKPQKIFKNIFHSTKKLIILRTNLDNKKKKFILKKKNRKLNYRVFAFKDILRIFKKNNFTPFILLDEATNYSKSKKKIFKNEYRSMYIVMGLKNEIK